MDFAFSDEQRLLRASVRSLMEAHAPAGVVRDLDRRGAYPYDLYARWVEAGLLALPFAEEFDGLGGSITDLTIVAEEIARHSADALMAYAGSVFCGLNIVRNGSPGQRAHWARRIIDGTTRMSIAISEPDAGSDVGAMRTKAVRDGDDWIVDGQKL